VDRDADGLDEFVVENGTHEAIREGSLAVTVTPMRDGTVARVRRSLVPVATGRRCPQGPGRRSPTDPTLLGEVRRRVDHVVSFAIRREIGSDGVASESHTPVWSGDSG
jgi:hypothetical protein